MKHRKSELIVPIRDRRQHVRILTLKNFGWATAVMVIAFLLLTVDWHRPMATDYGRLFGRQVAAPEAIAPRPIQVIAEAPVPDQTAADPLLVAPAARERELGIGGEDVPRAATETMAPAYTADVAPVTLGASHGRGVAIVGDANGVSIVQGGAAARPLLSGGIFKQ